MHEIFVAHGIYFAISSTNFDFFIDKVVIALNAANQQRKLVIGAETFIAQRNASTVIG